MSESFVGIGADADGRLVGAGDADLGDAVDLRDALHQHGVGGVVDGGGRQLVRGQGEDEHRCVVGIGLAEDRDVGQAGRQIHGGGVECSLHVARGTVDVPVDVEQGDDDGVAERTHRGELG